MKRIAFITFLFSMLTVFSGVALAQVDSEYDNALKYYNSGKFEEAVRLFKDYIQDRPRASAYYLIGYALYKLGKHKEAFKYFEEAYLIDPGYSPSPFFQAVNLPR